MNVAKNYRLVLALLTVALLWGTTFLGIRIAVHSIPPWFVAGIRQCIAALLILPYLIHRGELKLLPKKDLLTQMTLASLMLIMANGLMTVSEKHLSSSLAALISSTSPLLVFILSLILGMQKFSWKSLIGVALGFCGILLIFWDGIRDLANPDYRNGIIALIIGITGWAMGTVYSKKTHGKPQNIALNLFYQFAFAGIVQVILGFIFSGETNVAHWSLQSWAAMVYLGIFGSVVAFFAFNYAIKYVAPTQISILSYVNTVIAIFLGWLVLDEKITAKFLIAAAMIIGGVFIINYKPGMLKGKR